MWLVAAISLVVPFGVLAGLAAWARWLRVRTAAPLWLVVVPVALAFVGPPITGAMAWSVWTSAEGGLAVEGASRKATVLGRALSETMNTGVLLFAIAVVWLLVVTWRYRWRMGR